MSHESFPQRPVPRPTQDARDLLVRLYREIGISAVAAALQIPERQPEQRRPSVKDIPAILRGEDKAA
jgi:hypothetical protein